MFYLYLLFFGFLLNKLGTQLTIHLSKKHQLFEATDHRKIHVEKVSALGGIPIFCTFWGIFLLCNPVSSIIGLLFLATALLFGIGLWDDLKNIGIKPRVLAQILAANIAYFAGFHFGFLHEVLNYILSVTFIILMINGTNFIDGINGLAGSFGLLGFSFLAVLFYQFDRSSLLAMSILYAGILLGFLAHNFGKKADIFMGDNGSTIMGFVLAILSLKIIQIVPLTNNSTFYILPILTLVALPILDLFAVVAIRLTNGQSPFKADRIHLHHLLTIRGKSHPESCQFIIAWLLGIAAIFYFQIITSFGFGISLIIISYLLIRLQFTTTGLPFTINRAPKRVSELKINEV